jgi:hypothetical protein
MKKDQPFLDQISSEFTKIYLKDLSDADLRKLLQLVEYLKLDDLKNVLCVYVASKYFFYYNEDKMRKEIAANQIFYSRQMEINLKKDMAEYAQQFSKDLLEKYRKQNIKK